MTTHSLFGVSKAAADLLVQEYGRYFQMPTVCFRGGCLSGPQHAGAQLHGFLAYLMKCTVTGDALHDLRLRRQAGPRQHSRSRRGRARLRPSTRSRAPRRSTTSAVGASRNVSMLEAIELCEAISGRELHWSLADQPRIGDHRWWISSLAEFKADYPGWQLTSGIEQVLREIYESNAENWLAGTTG